MEPPAGRAVTLRSGDYEAVVVEVGGGIRTLTRDGLDVISGYADNEMCWACRGQLLIPWPNRIEDGAYDFGGQHYQLGLSEAGKFNASHGLTRWANWQLAEQSESAASWTYRLHPSPGYPFALDLVVRYELSAAGLRTDIAATNIGTEAAPYGHGAHPYLTVGRQIDECELTLPASTRSEVDERSIPFAAEPVPGEYDFRETRLIGTAAFDHPFGDLAAIDGEISVVLRDPDSGRTSTLTADAAYNWFQVFSGDALPRLARASLAVEPMTCPPNAFRSGINLITLEPGATHSAGFTLS